MATRSKAEYTLKSELYALADCGENRIADINSGIIKVVEGLPNLLRVFREGLA